MRLITLLVPEAYLKILDELVSQKKRYPSRSEAIRLAIRDLILTEASK